MVVSDELRRRFWRYVKRGPECWEWIGAKRNDGYGVIGIGTRKQGTIRAHRLAWLIAGRDDPGRDRFLCHRCDNPSCVRISHLFAGTPRDNHADMRAKGRGVNPPKMCGTSNVNAKLDRSKVNLIRKLSADGLTSIQIAPMFGVHHATIRKVINGKLWS